ncbi:AraC family transcriptional regulator [Conexibacter sp. SYSU D00693]|uniref:helix-turn-helix domain-containing protein n=1 Tax=Conexibacter sp. SYSU D00693 TaxID=2812560 RepID=UPI00196B94D9|nr:AraC family transcriptional regulator [Conexibacter sp. SYSU D00693]
MADAQLLMSTAVPHPALRPYVRALYGYVETAVRPGRRRELPVAQTVLVVNLGAPLLVAGSPTPEDRCFPDGLVAGLGTGSVFTSVPGGIQEGVQALITPLGCQRLCGVAMHELAEGSFRLDDVLGREAARLVDRLRHTPSWTARLELLQRFLLDRILDGRPAPPDVAHAWSRLEATDGRLRVGELAAELRCSTRHLTNRFRDHVGIPPKQAARVLRFQRAWELFEGGTGAARAAAEAGFADQAHFSREVRDLTGLAPTALLAVRRSDSSKSGPLPLT